MMEKLARVGALLVVLGVLSGCELAAGQLLAMFEFVIEPQVVTVEAGSDVNVRVIIKPLTGITLSAVSVRLVSAPVGVSANPNPITVFTRSDWGIAVASNVAPGTYEGIAVEAVSQGINLIPVTRQTTFTLVVESAVP
ncbi:hypothetical protein BH23DEI1_BH23DEI1_17490 [soil metagenome]